MSFVEKALVLLLAAAILGGGIAWFMQRGPRLPEVKGETQVYDKPPAELPR